jgi:hypothetical protein
MQLDLGTDVPMEGLLRFSPRNPRIPFLGRKTELEVLDDFVSGAQERPFMWWLVTGGSGVGKTRLARELCLRMRRKGWQAGFLPRSNISGLDAWCPLIPTLIACDCAMERVDEIRHLMAHLVYREGLPPVRLLLLEREADKLLENRLSDSDQTQAEIVGRARYLAEPLSLTGLTDDEIWNLVRAFPWRSNATYELLNRTDFFQRLGELDSQHRPLVAMILAETIATSATGASLGGLDTLLRFLLQRDRDHLWPKELGVEKIG